MAVAEAVVKNQMVPVGQERLVKDLMEELVQRLQTVVVAVAALAQLEEILTEEQEHQ